MSVKIFHIPFHYRGATELLLNTAVGKIRSPDYSKILYIAPTPRKVRDAQQIFHNLKGGCYISPEMLTIKQLSKRLYSLYGEKHIIPEQLIPVILARISGGGIGYASIIADFINEIKQYHPSKGIDTVEGELISIFSELGIPEEVSSRAKEALEMYKTYQEILKKEAVLDEDDVMTLCPHLIQKHLQVTDFLILDGFYELTKSELDAPAREPAGR